jgi:uncharacterized protein YciI
MSTPDAAGREHIRGTFVVTAVAGPHRDLAHDTREQPFWNEHAQFIDRLVEDGFILLGGPLVDEGGSILIVRARDEQEVRERLKDDPWYREGILRQQSIKRWQIFIDRRG